MANNSADGKRPTGSVAPAKNSRVEALLLDQFPGKMFTDSVRVVFSAYSQKSREVPPTEFDEQVEDERRRLSMLPEAELHRLYEAMRLRQAAASERIRLSAIEKKRVKAEAKEAARFYNLPKAAADFSFWSKMEFWTFEEALALLLAKNPKVVTRAAVKREIESFSDLMFVPAELSALPVFLQRYVQLRELAERAAVMNLGRIRPIDALVWAHRSGATEPPSELVKYVAARLPKPAPAAKASVAAEAAREVQAPSASSEAPAMLKRSALIDKHLRAWLSIETDLRHGNDNGLAVAKSAKHGFWLEGKALDWARQNGKLPASPPPGGNSANAPFRTEFKAR